MKKVVFIFIFIALSGYLTTANAAKIRIGKVNLALAVSLHPQMSLFDFDRMGFFKIPPGLSKEQFDVQLKALKDRPLPPELEKRQQRCNQEIARLDRRKRELMQSLAGAQESAGRKITEELDVISAQDEKLRGEISDIEYQKLCPDLTSPEETRKILEKIETEVMKIIEKIAVDENYDLVLNTSVTAPINYPVKYKSGEMYGLGVPGIDYSLFYSFLANKDHILPNDDIPESRKLINWLELTNSPAALNMLPIKPYPLVIHGGEDLTAKVVREIYKKYQIDEKILKAVLSVLKLIDEHSQNFDTKIKSLVNPK
ncbi:MAG: hypothetical protein Kow0029_23080 [Candidatus Rifleibacteriota bacterium]